MFGDINALGLWDFRIDSFGTSEEGDNVLWIHGATSVYVTAATLQFTEVEFLSVPTGFHHAQFRHATPKEVVATRRRAEFDCELFAIDTDFAEHSFFIAAASARVTVLGQ